MAGSRDFPLSMQGLGNHYDRSLEFQIRTKKQAAALRNHVKVQLRTLKNTTAVTERDDQ